MHREKHSEKGTQGYKQGKSRGAAASEILQGGAETTSKQRGKEIHLENNFKWKGEEDAVLVIVTKSLLKQKTK